MFVLDDPVTVYQVVVQHPEPVLPDQAGVGLVLMEFLLIQKDPTAFATVAVSAGIYTVTGN